MATKVISKTQQQKNADIVLKAINEKWDIIRLSRYYGKTIAEMSRVLNYWVKQNSKFEAIFEERKWPLNISTGHIYTGSFHTEIISKQQDTAESTIILNLIERLLDSGKKEYPKSDKNNKIRAAMAGRLRILKKKYLDKVEIVEEGGSTVYGERRGSLSQYEHVFVRPVLGRRHSEMFMVETEKEYQILFGYNAKESIDETTKKIIPAHFVEESEKWFTKKEVLAGAVQKYNTKTNYTPISLAVSSTVEYQDKIISRSKLELNIDAEKTDKITEVHYISSDSLIAANKQTKKVAIRFSKILVTKKHRLRYSPGKWQGAVDNKFLISVNYDWK